MTEVYFCCCPGCGIRSTNISGRNQRKMINRKKLYNVTVPSWFIFTWKNHCCSWNDHESFFVSGIRNDSQCWRHTGVRESRNRDTTSPLREHVNACDKHANETHVIDAYWKQIACFLLFMARRCNFGDFRMFFWFQERSKIYIFLRFLTQNLCANEFMFDFYNHFFSSTPFFTSFSLVILVTAICELRISVLKFNNLLKQHRNEKIEFTSRLAFIAFMRYVIINMKITNERFSSVALCTQLGI